MLSNCGRLTSYNMQFMMHRSCIEQLCLRLNRIRVLRRLARSCRSNRTCKDSKYFQHPRGLLRSLTYHILACTFDRVVLFVFVHKRCGKADIA